MMKLMMRMKLWCWKVSHEIVLSQAVGTSVLHFLDAKRGREEVSKKKNYPENISHQIKIPAFHKTDANYTQSWPDIRVITGWKLVQLCQGVASWGRDTLEHFLLCSHQLRCNSCSTYHIHHLQPVCLSLGNTYWRLPGKLVHVAKCIDMWGRKILNTLPLSLMPNIHTSIRTNIHGSKYSTQAVDRTPVLTIYCCSFPYSFCQHLLTVTRITPVSPVYHTPVVSGSVATPSTTRIIGVWDRKLLPRKKIILCLIVIPNQHR